MKYSSNRNSFYHNVLITSAMLISIAACSSSGDSGPPPDTTPPSITVTSHTDAQEIIGNRTITLQGNVSDDTQNVSILQNGASVTATFNGNTFSADITLADRENTLEISATDAANNRADIVVNLYYPFLSLNDGQAASMVIGQPDFVSSTSNRGAGVPSANSFDRPWGPAAVSSNGVLFVPDCYNNRVLVFNQIPVSFDEPADYVLGQNDFVSNTSGISDLSFSCPNSVRIFQDKLLVSEFQNQRVLIWNTIPTGSDQPANLVLGQLDFDTTAYDCSAQIFAETADGFAVANKVIVTDSDNSRILIWNDINGLTNGQQADIVLGQANFTSCQANRGGVAGADTLQFPNGVWSNGTNLIVADTSNNRVLIWNTFPTQNGQPADVVLGQDNMQTTNADLCQSCLNNPFVVHSNGNQLFVGESTNSRVLVWDSIPGANND
ncbi:MAG: hypothetical protein PVJ72_11810, partial [Gammaproteobacteria bacterium]